MLHLNSKSAVFLPHERSEWTTELVCTCASAAQQKARHLVSNMWVHTLLLFVIKQNVGNLLMVTDRSGLQSKLSTTAALAARQDSCSHRSTPVLLEETNPSVNKTSILRKWCRYFLYSSSGLAWIYQLKHICAKCNLFIHLVYLGACIHLEPYLWYCCLIYDIISILYDIIWLCYHRLLYHSPKIMIP